jgi:hypothetical protein
VAADRPVLHLEICDIGYIRPKVIADKTSIRVDQEPVWTALLRLTDSGISNIKIARAPKTLNVLIYSLRFKDREPRVC